MDEKKIIFINGLHRSGTSLLFKCLREHPQISGFKGTDVQEDEGQHLQSVYPPASIYGGPGRFGFHPSSYLNETSELVSLDNKKKLFAEWSKYWDLEKPFLMEKSPPNIIRSRFLQALYPESYFITILRHPIAVSYATQKWIKNPLYSSLYSLFEHWLSCHERFDLDTEYLQRSLVIKYEDFVAAPQIILNNIYAFLDINSITLNKKVNFNVNNKYFLKWQGLRKDKLKSFYTKYLIARFKKRIDPFGYSLINLD